MCYDAYSMNLKKDLLDGASENIKVLENHVRELKKESPEMLMKDANSVDDFAEPNDHGEFILAPLFVDESCDGAISGTIRKADHFLRFLRKIIKAL
jgi:DNA excision repair protein ERCC-2